MAQTKNRVDWPRTFSGQPDFDFERSEVIADITQKEGAEAAITPTLEKVITTPTFDDPLYLGTPADGNQGPKLAGAVDFDAEDTTIQSLEELSEFEMKAAQLPSVQAQNELIDLSEFKTFLEGIIDKTVKATKPNLEEVNPNALLDKLLLQAISHQPNKYVIINNKRYEEGDRFSLPLVIIPSNDRIGDAIAAYMPSTQVVTPDTYALYEEVRAKTMKEYLARKKENLEAFKIIHPVSVTIKRIEHRKIVVEMLGKEHVLEIRFAL